MGSLLACSLHGENGAHKSTLRPRGHQHRKSFATHPQSPCRPCPMKLLHRQDARGPAVCVIAAMRHGRRRLNFSAAITALFQVVVAAGVALSVAYSREEHGTLVL